MKFRIRYPELPALQDHDFVEEIVEFDTEDEAYREAIGLTGIFELVSIEEKD